MKQIAFALLTLLVMTAPALAQTKIGKATANQYFENCNQQEDSRLSKKSQEALCACTAAKMMENMTIEDMNTMTQDSDAGRAALNKMIISVYGPCMEFPVEDLINAQCMENPQINPMTNNKPALCGCIAKGVGKFFASEGKDMLEQILKQNPNIEDPITPILESPELRNETQKMLLSCMQQRR